MQCDVKGPSTLLRTGLYKTSQGRVSRNGQKARAGQIAEFSGISSSYEVPGKPELTLNTGVAGLDLYVQQMVEELIRLGIVECH